MIRRKDPGAMSAAERLAELGALLATGYRRHRLRQNELADAPEPEPTCDPVDGTENPKEVA